MAVKPTIEGISLSEITHVRVASNDEIAVKPGSVEEKANGLLFIGLSSGNKHWVNAEQLISVRNG
jgi:hypothetical protein